MPASGSAVFARSPGRVLRLLAASALVFFCCHAWAETAIPPLRTRVTDMTATLTAEQSRTLESTLAAFEQSKGSQIAVLIVSSTKPEALEQYSMRVAEAWKVGRKGADDGVILVVAKDDHRLRIEVGRGLEGAIPDVVAKRLIREIIAPHFLGGDFYGGISEGATQLMKLIDGESLPAAPVADPQKAQGGHDLPSEYVLLILAVLIVFIRQAMGRFFGAVAGASIAGLLGWWLFGGLVAFAVAAVLGFIIMLLLPASVFDYAPLHGGGGGSGWHSSGGDWSGGSSDSGGFSGGGGDFGGGGASGDW